MKRRVFFSLVLLASFATSVFAHDFEVNHIFYQVKSKADKTVEVTFKGATDKSYANEYASVVRIPETVTHDGQTYTVVGITDRAFSNQESLTQGEVPNTVENIGESAFEGCEYLSKLTLGRGVVNVGYDAFKNCRRLLTLHIDCEVIPEGWFTTMRQIETLVLGEHVKTVDDYAFLN